MFYRLSGRAKVCASRVFVQCTAFVCLILTALFLNACGGRSSLTTTNQGSTNGPGTTPSNSGSSGGSTNSGGSSSGGSSNSGGSSGSSSGGNSASSSAKSFTNVQKAGGWNQFGQGPPDFVDCSPSPCNGISFSMTQNVNDPSKSGSATVFNVAGEKPYGDALFNNHLIGPSSSQGMFDNDASVTSNLHDFTYDVDFYGNNLDPSEALEFDINQFFHGMGFTFGHECRIAAGHEWAVWDSQNGHWVGTGVPCYPKSNTWNHVTLKMHRTSDNHLRYESITLNGQTATLNWSLGHASAPGNWYGVTVNYQMDGNVHQDSYNVYLDNLTISYQ